MARERFENVFSHIRSELIDHITAQGMPKEAIEWYAKVRATPILQHPDVALSCAEPRLQRARRKVEQRSLRRRFTPSSQGHDLDRG